MSHQVRAAAAVAAPAPEKEKYEARSVAGFKLVRNEFVAEYDSQVLTYQHEKTGDDALQQGRTSTHGLV